MGGADRGGSESQCGWLKDRYGVSWQVVPSVLGQLLGGPDPEGAQRAMQAMLGMRKLDIAELQRPTTAGDRGVPPTGHRVRRAMCILLSAPCRVSNPYSRLSTALMRTMDTTPGGTHAGERMQRPRRRIPAVALTSDGATLSEGVPPGRPEKIRNVALVGHSGAGKTMLLEALLAATGAISRMGSIADGTTVSDSDPSAIHQQRSVALSVVPVVSTASR